MAKCSSLTKKRIVVSHRYATKANALMIGDSNVFFVIKRRSCSANILFCNFAISKMIFLTVGNSLLRFLTNLESGSLGYVPMYIVYDPTQ